MPYSKNELTFLWLLIENTLPNSYHTQSKWDYKQGRLNYLQNKFLRLKKNEMFMRPKINTMEEIASVLTCHSTGRI